MNLTLLIFLTLIAIAIVGRLIFGGSSLVKIKVESISVGFLCFVGLMVLVYFGALWVSSLGIVWLIEQYQEFFR